MTPQEALALVDQLCAQVQLNRQQHAQVAEALRVLASAIEKPE